MRGVHQRPARIDLGVVATRPIEFRVTRTARIAAPPAALFAQVNDFRKWDAWNPWAKIDPAMKQSYEGPPAGVGAVYAWVDDPDALRAAAVVGSSRTPQTARLAPRRWASYA